MTGARRVDGSIIQNEKEKKKEGKKGSKKGPQASVHIASSFLPSTKNTASQQEPRRVTSQEASSKLTRSTDSDGCGSKTQRFQHVRASSNSTINVNFSLIEHLRFVSSDLEQRLQRRRSPFQLSTSVIAEVDPFDAMLDRQSCVFCRLNSFEDQWQTGQLTKVGQVGPIERCVDVAKHCSRERRFRRRRRPVRRRTRRARGANKGTSEEAGKFQESLHPDLD